MENKAAYLDGPMAALRVAPAPLTQPAANEILIRNHAIAINPLDWKQQQYGALISLFPHVRSQVPLPSRTANQRDCRY
jgi:NADPH:quinone reductase-like Zn-dependent oxidoreductase